MKYNVYIVNIETFKSRSLIGTHLDDSAKNLSLSKGTSYLINEGLGADFYCQDVEVGSERDLELQADLVK